MLVADVKVEIVISFEPKVADGTRERLIVDVSLKMRFHVRLGRKSFAAYVTVVGLCVLVQALVETPQSSDLEILLAISTLERAIGWVSHLMSGEIFLCLKTLVAQIALEVEDVAVGRFMSHHVGLLDERLSTDAALVRLFSGVKLHVTIQRKLLRERFLTNFALVGLFLRFDGARDDFVSSITLKFRNSAFRLNNFLDLFSHHFHIAFSSSGLNFDSLVHNFHRLQQVSIF